MLASWYIRNVTLLSSYRNFTFHLGFQFQSAVLENRIISVIVFKNRVDKHCSHMRFSPHAFQH